MVRRKYPLAKKQNKQRTEKLLCLNYYYSSMKDLVEMKVETKFMVFKNSYWLVKIIKQLHKNSSKLSPNV